ncbi:MAG: aconitase X catalytic domain-containing protein [SAR324 cluster bacterium]|nr:aconitase X catalytic domain-containing protein [SAR324 cluster bacterium]MCZ6730409.1 aconitase X catalytic domain-containing protein [SAR324 cluster bacterium]
MRLTDLEEAMLAGEHGEPRRFAMEQLVQVGEFFDAEDCVEISHVHLMADTEALGESGVAFLEQLAAHPFKERRVRVPTLTDPRGADFKAYKRIRQSEAIVALERRAIEALRALGIMMTDTCIIYQTIQPPTFGEHVAYGDTGSTIYANSVLGARSNFEGGPAALSAALTGRVPRYGFHLEERRRGSTLFRLEDRPRCLSDWGAVGGIVGRSMTSYWEVPVIAGVSAPVRSDELKHFGAALASFGSTPLFHMVGITPEARDLATAFDGTPPQAHPIGRADIDAFYASYGIKGEGLDVVVFAAPQMSLFEMEQLAGLLDGKRVHGKTTVLIATSPEVKAASDRMGLTETIETSGAIVLEGVCFYQMHAREIGEANGWRTLMTNSAKLVNIIGGYGYQPTLRPMERCIACAVAGKVLP